MDKSIIYHNNIEALSARNANVVEFLENYKGINEKNEEDSNINTIVDIINNRPIITVKTKDSSFRLSSVYSDKNMLDIWFDGLAEAWGIDAKCIMYGLGNGSFVRKFLSSARKDCSIAVHEPSVEIFKTVLENYDMTDIFKEPRFRLIFWPALENETIKHFYANNIIQYSDLNTLSITFHPNYPRIFQNDLKNFAEGMVNTQSFVAANQNVQSRFGLNYNENTFNNFKYMAESKSISSLRNNMPEGIPAIVVAAGPSLDKNIDELRNAVGKCLIVSTDTALRPLAKKGIRPDIAIIMDGKKDARYMSEQESRKVPLVCSLRAGGSFLDLHEGNKYFIDAYCEHINEFCEKEGIDVVKLPTGGSVANGAFSIARYLKCKTIIFVGQDLAYTGNKTHSGVTVRGEVPTAIEDLEHVEWCYDIYGNKVRSSGEFRIYREWFEEQIREHEELKVYDATEGGAKIDGTELISLKDVIEKECTKEFDFEKIEKLSDSYFNDVQKDKFEKYVETIPDELSKLESIAKKSISDYIAMLKLIKREGINSSKIKKLYVDIKKQSSQMENIKVMEYVTNQLQEKTSELLDVINVVEDDETQELISTCEIAKKHLEDIIGAIEELKELEKTIK